MALLLPYEIARMADLPESFVKRVMDAAIPGYIHRAGHGIRMVRREDADEVIRLLKQYRKEHGRPRRVEAAV